MARSGVRKLGERPPPRRSQPAPPRPATPAAPSPPPVAPAVAPSQKPLALPKGDPRAELWGEVERLRALQQRSDAEIQRLRAGLAAEQAARQEREAASEALTQAAAELEAERDSLRERLLSTARELAEVDQHRRSLQRALAEADEAEPPRPAPARAVLEARGLVGDSELELALRGLSDQREGVGLLALLQVSDREALETFLEDRVALICGDPACQPPPGRAILRVPPARCDVCGGSDIRRAVRRFQDAALLNGLGRITIVGGSPQYHRQIRALIEEPRLRLNLVPGDRRRNLRQAKADEEGSDLVVLWGATLLDHSLSELYGRGEGRLIRVPHRGIARMFEWVAEALA